MRHVLLVLLSTLFSITLLSNESSAQGPQRAIAMHGEPMYPMGVNRFPFIDQDAEYGGELKIGIAGTFDSLNPLIVKGTPPKVPLEVSYSLLHLHSLERLMVRNPDEPFSLYGLIAETIETPDDRSWVEFVLNPQAAFSDGTPITVEDVIFSWEILRDNGLPNVRRYYSLVSRVETRAPHTVRFIFSEKGNRELPMILGLMSVFSKADWDGKDFGASSLEPPLTSGPYIASEIDPGRKIRLERNPNYWGRDLPVNQGMHNFDVIEYEFFRDNSAMLEAFKTSQLNLRVEHDAKAWATNYDFLATRNGQVTLAEISHQRVAGMNGFVFNTRKSIFSDVRVRDALILLFDFDWMNENFFYGEYQRVQSYFDNSELGSTGRPATDEERDLLGKYERDVRRDILERGWIAPRGNNPGIVRENKRNAIKLLSQAGWGIENGALVYTETGEPFTFEIMVRDSQNEKIALNYAQSLKDVGIDASVSMTEKIQYETRRMDYDFDMMPFGWGGTLSPGNEQAFRFGSAEADIPGSYNLAGVKSKAVDKMIDAITNAETRQELATAARALDRLLLSGSYVVPFYYSNIDRVAYWSELNIPMQHPLTGMKIQTWWMYPDN